MSWKGPFKAIWSDSPALNRGTTADQVLRAPSSLTCRVCRDGALTCLGNLFMWLWSACGWAGGGRAGKKRLPITMGGASYLPCPGPTWGKSQPATASNARPCSHQCSAFTRMYSVLHFHLQIVNSVFKLLSSPKSVISNILPAPT